MVTKNLIVKIQNPVVNHESRPVNLKSAGVCGVMTYESKTQPLQIEDMIRVKWNDARTIVYVCNIRPEGRFLQRKLRLDLNCIE